MSLLCEWGLSRRDHSVAVGCLVFSSLRRLGGSAKAESVFGPDTDASSFVCAGYLFLPLELAWAVVVEYGCGRRILSERHVVAVCRGSSSTLR